MTSAAATEHAAQFERLWVRAQCELWAELRATLAERQLAILENQPRNHVRYCHADGTSHAGSARYFSLKDADAPGRKPLIALYREQLPEDPFTPDLTCPHDELITLAHEFGHFLSDRAGHHTTGYLAARALLNSRERGETKESLSREQAQLVLDEEERAWALGRDVLCEHGFDELRQFEEARDRNLETYRTELRPALEQR